MSRRLAHRRQCTRYSYSYHPVPLTSYLTRHLTEPRSPQAVHTLQLPYLVNKDIIEIGTRGGDGIQCFAHVAKTATAIELRPHYCKRSRARARMLRRPFDVKCKDYNTVHTLDADVFLF